MLFALYWCFHSILFPSRTITRSQRWILAWGLWFCLCAWRRRRTGCGWYWGPSVIPHKAQRRMMCEERSRLESSSAALTPQFNRSIYSRNLIIWLVGMTIMKQQVWCGKKKKSLHVRSWALNVFYSHGPSIGNVCFQVKCTFVWKYMRTFASGFIAFEHDCSARCNRDALHRMKDSTLHGLFSLSLFPNIPSAVELAKVTNSKINVQNMFRTSTNVSLFTLSDVTYNTLKWSLKPDI